MMTIFWRRLYIVALLLAGGIAPVTAAAFQALDSITAAAASASEKRAAAKGYDNVSVEVRPLDQRLSLPQCSEALTSFTPAASAVLGAVSVGIKCTGPKPWTIYVRTVVTAQQAVPVLIRPLARNTVISKNDIELVNRPAKASANGIIYEPAQIIGMELTRALDAGSHIRISQLRAPKVIKRGQQVTLIAGGNGLEVRIQGKALSNATAGDRIMVTNMNSGNRVEGIAHSDGTVSVP